MNSWVPHVVFLKLLGIQISFDSVLAIERAIVATEISQVKPLMIQIKYQGNRAVKCLHGLI